MMRLRFLSVLPQAIVVAFALFNGAVLAQEPGKERSPMGSPASSSEYRNVMGQLSTTLEAGVTSVASNEQPATAPASPPPPPPADVALTSPGLVDAATISGGNTAWMLMSTTLVLMMTIPGLALFYGGMVRKKNVLGTLAHSFSAVFIVSILWVIIGYSLAFTPGSLYLGSLDRVMLQGMALLKDAGKISVSHIAPTIPESLFVMYQMTFAIVTVALITGAFAERMKFSALLLFVILWSLIVYVPVAHWVWEPSGWLASRGVLDFAGGTVVHINAGISGLVAAIIIGPRTGYGKEHMPPHNLVLTFVGASMLWVGWFGFNAGSANAANGQAAMAMLVTQVAAATGAVGWMCIEWIRRGTPSVLGLVSGAVAGLVAITPASGFVGVNGALVIGGLAGIACFLAATSLKSMLGYDDSLDVFGVHAIAGIIGALLTAAFNVKAMSGTTSTLGNQAFGVMVTIIYASVMTTIILFVIKLLIGLRIPQAQEVEGLDIEQHGETVA